MKEHGTGSYRLSVAAGNLTGHYDLGFLVSQSCRVQHQAAYVHSLGVTSPDDTLYSIKELQPATGYALASDRNYSTIS